jgi:SOS response regulatory protein OraA/RecX
MNKEVSKLPKEEADRVMELPNSYREKGREEGITLKEKQVISNMLKKGFSDELIAEIAEVDLSELEEIKKQL